MNGSEVIDLEYILDSARKVVLMLNERNEQGLIMHAKEHGRNWAKHNMDLLLKLEWIQHLRKLYWDCLFHFYKKCRKKPIGVF